MEAVHLAMGEALKIPGNARNIRFHDYHPEDFQVPAGKSENYIFIEISMFTRRSLQAEKELYKGIVANLGKLGILASDAFIVLHEVSLENWGIRDGIPASEVD